MSSWGNITAITQEYQRRRRSSPTSTRRNYTKTKKQTNVFQNLNH